MLQNPKKVSIDIVKWIKEQVELRNKKNILIYNKHDTSSWLLNYLCKKTLIEIVSVSDNDNVNSYIADISNQCNSLIISSRCRNDVLFIRNYDKFEPIDIMPFANLKLSEIEQLCIEAKGHVVKDDGDISKEDLEWLDELNGRSNIITSEKDPTKGSTWFKYTAKQKALIAKVHQMEKLSRHKLNPNIPVFTI